MGWGSWTPPLHLTVPQKVAAYQEDPLPGLAGRLGVSAASQQCQAPTRLLTAGSGTLLMCPRLQLPADNLDTQPPRLTVNPGSPIGPGNPVAPGLPWPPGSPFSPVGPSRP